MSRGGELVKNTGILLIGRISTRAISFLLLPLYTAYLSEIQYGVVDLVSTLITLLCPVVGLQLDQALFRFMVPYRKQHNELSRIISSAIFAELCFIFVYICIFLLVSYWIHNEYKWFLLTNVIVATLLGFATQILRGFGQNTDYAISSFIASIGTISLNILFIVVFGWGAYGMLAAIFIGNLIAIAFCVVRGKLGRYLHFRNFNMSTLKAMIHYSVPLIPNELSWWAIRASDRLIISAFLGLAATGIISVSHKFPEIFMTVYSVFGLAWTESIVLHYKEQDGLEYFSRNTNNMMIFFSSVNLVILSFIPILFHFLVNVKFDESYNLIPLYFLATIINVVIGLISVIYVANNETKTIAKTSVIGACVSIVTDIALVKIIGIYASPISCIIGFGTMLFYRAIDMRRLAIVKWNYKFIIYFILAFIGVSLCYYSKSYALYALSILGACLFSILFNYRQISALSGLVKNKFKHT